MGALLALVSAAIYGVTDVVGGLAACRMAAVRVAFLAQLGGLATALCVAPVFRPGLLTWAGVIAAVPALWLVSGPGPGGTPGDAGAVRDGLASSVGVAVQYFALAQAGAGSGIWPVTAGRVTAVALVGLAVLATRGSAPPATRPGWRVHLAAVLSGVGAAAGLVAYLPATRLTLVTVAVALAALYPVVPVLVGVTALGERPRRVQVAGLALAGVASALLVLP